MGIDMSWAPDRKVPVPIGIEADWALGDSPVRKITEGPQIHAEGPTRGPTTNNWTWKLSIRFIESFLHPESASVHNKRILKSH